MRTTTTHTHRSGSLAAEGEGPRPGLTARIGAWSAEHRKAAILGWIAFVVVALFAGSNIGTRELTNAEQTPGESGAATKTLTDTGLAPASESVFVHSDTLKANDPGFERVVGDVTAKLSDIGMVRHVSSPADGGGAVSADGHSALVQFEVAGDPDTASDRIGPVTSAVDELAAKHPQLRIEEFGDASANAAIDDAFSQDMQRAETLSLPITLLILVIAFGSLVAAGVPLLLGISAVMATFGLIALPSQLLPMSSDVASVILLVGLAVGVDYSLFYLRREREERARGRSSRDALRIASATSGRAVLVSGLTVIAAMAGMLLTGDGTFISFGVATMLVVAVAMTASVTVLPAILSWLGDRVERGRIPLLGRLVARKPRQGSGAWGTVVDRVLRRPALSVALAGGALIALAVPALGMNMQVTGPDQFPRELPIVQTYDRIEAAFPGENIPALVAVSADDVRSPEVAQAIDELTSAGNAGGVFANRSTVAISNDGTAARIDVPIAGNGNDERSKQALERLRQQLIPAAFGSIDGVSVDVSGQTAQTVDFGDRMNQRLPLVFGFVLMLAFVLMLVTFRSIVIPLKAIVLNLLSVGAAYGVLVLVFQHGLGHELLGFDTPGSITAWLPLFLFVILFGLSMDYHVFIVSRIREYVDRGMSTDAAVRAGITDTAGTVSSAAIVMVAVFAIFATLRLIDMKEMGVGLAVAVLIDATVVRAVLLPASMKLLGKWNWYLPSSLGWLPRTRRAIEPEPEPVPSA